MSTPTPKSRPIMPRKCKTCPWVKGSPTEHLRAELSESAKTVGRICHSSHKGSIVYGDNPPIKEESMCRGARDEQLIRLTLLGFLPEPSDAAWQAACDRFGITRDAI